MTRRAFLGRLRELVSIGGPLLLGIPWLTKTTIGRRSRDPGGGPKAPVTPPGSITLRHFRSNCTGCHRCVANCPTGVLQPSLLDYGVTGLLKPVLDFSKGYCEYPCTICGGACPTGAISKLSEEQKSITKIGRVYLVKEDCIVFTRGTPCGACAEICPTQAIRMVAYRPGLTQPLTDEASCVGCGGCELVCPARPKKAVYVAGIDPHRAASIPNRPPSPTKDASPPPEEFPF